jgi:hypothetical protein
MDTAKHEIVLIEEAHIRPMMGLGILEPLPSAGPGDALTVEEDQLRTRIMLMAQKPVRRDAYLQRTGRRLMPPHYPGPVTSWLSCSGLPRLTDSDLPTKKDKR